MPLPAEPPEHIRRLLDELGAEWYVDAVAAARLRVEPEVVDEITSRWCPHCREWGLPHDRTGLCLWCDGPMQDAPLNELPEREEEPMSSTTLKSETCKIHGCTNEVLQMQGRYAKLCAEHTAERKQAKPGESVGGTPRAATSQGEYAKRVRSLLLPAKRLDSTAAKLARVASPEKAQAELAEAMRRVQGSPSVENLEQLAAAAKAMASGQPKRQKLSADHAAALRMFKASVASLARDLSEA